MRYSLDRRALCFAIAFAFATSACSGARHAQEERGESALTAEASTRSVIVDTFDDLPDETPDGICRTAAGTCSLLAALEDAPIGSTVQLEAGRYDLVRPAVRPVVPATITLDRSLTIRGVGAATDVVIASATDFTQLDVTAGVTRFESLQLVADPKPPMHTNDFKNVGIEAGGKLALDHVVVTGFRTSLLFSVNGALDVVRSSVIDNEGVLVEGTDATILIDEAFFTGNVATFNATCDFFRQPRPKLVIKDTAFYRERRLAINNVNSADIEIVNTIIAETSTTEFRRGDVLFLNEGDTSFRNSVFYDNPMIFSQFNFPATIESSIIVQRSFEDTPISFGAYSQGGNVLMSRDARPIAPQATALGAGPQPTDVVRTNADDDLFEPLTLEDHGAYKKVKLVPKRGGLADGRPLP